MGFPMENELSCKRSTAYHPPLNFNNIPVAQMNSQKHLGMQLDKKLNFEEHLNKLESKVKKLSILFANYNMSFHERHFLQFTSHSLTLT